MHMYVSRFVIVPRSCYDSYSTNKKISSFKTRMRLERLEAHFTPTYSSDLVIGLCRANPVTWQVTTMTCVMLTVEQA